jgi:hypothetical protein
MTDVAQRIVSAQSFVEAGAAVTIAKAMRSKARKLPPDAKVVLIRIVEDDEKGTTDIRAYDEPEPFDEPELGEPLTFGRLGIVGRPGEEDAQEKAEATALADVKAEAADNGGYTHSSSPTRMMRLVRGL